MIEIKTIPLSKLLILEMNPLLGNVVRILKSHNPELLRLTDTLKVLQDEELQTKKLDVPYRGHALTKPHQKLHERRLSFAAYIAQKLRSIYIGDYNNTLEYSEIAYPFMKIHLEYLREETQWGAEAKIETFLTGLKLNPDMMEIFVKLGFETDIKELERMNDECNAIYSLMQKQKSERPKIDKKAILKDAQSTLRYVFHQINRYQRTFKHLDYAPLINELNEQLTVFSKNISLRTTLNKKRANEGKKSDKEEFTTTSNKDIAQNMHSSNLPAVIEKNQINHALQNMLDMLKKMKDDKDKDTDKNNKPKED